MLPDAGPQSACTGVFGVKTVDHALPSQWMTVLPAAYTSLGPKPQTRLSGPAPDGGEGWIHAVAAGPGGGGGGGGGGVTVAVGGAVIDTSGSVVNAPRSTSGSTSVISTCRMPFSGMFSSPSSRGICGAVTTMR